MPTLKKHRVF